MNGTNLILRPGPIQRRAPAVHPAGTDRGVPVKAGAVIRRSGADSTTARSALQPLVVAGFAITLILSPIQFVVLPLNLSLVDLWNTLFLPFSWLYLVHARQALRLPYFAAMLLILIGSLLGTLFAPIPQTSFLAIVKDLYLYVWFVTVASVLVTFSARDFRRIMIVWSGVLIVHGLLIAGQFVSSDVFQQVTSLTSRFGALDRWRPSGLFENANATALFQVLGFVPLFLCRARAIIVWPLSVLLLFSVLATGSMASIAGFAFGLVIATSALAIVARSLTRSIQVVGIVVGSAVLLGGAFAVLLAVSPALAARIEYVTIGRATGSAEGRFSLWERGIEALGSETVLTGIGPDAYKDIDVVQKPLHNDLLAFLVERGLIGTIGLILLATTAVLTAARILMREIRDSFGIWPVVIFLAALTAATVHGQFHQIFHHRSIWLVLAVQEAFLVRGLADLGQRDRLNNSRSEYLDRSAQRLVVRG